MSKTAILLDSTFLLNEEYIKKNNIYIIPLIVNFSNASFKEEIGTEYLLEEIFTKIKNEKSIPKTSQPSVQDFLNIYQQIKDDGYNKVLGFFITSNLSGTYQGAQNAASIFIEENEGFKIQNYDSLNVALSSLPVQEIVQHINIAGDITEQTINEKLENYSKNTKILLSVDSLEYLALGGRISPALAAIGNLFDVKPLLQIKEGQILEHSKVRSQKKSYKKILEIFESEVVKNKDKTFLLIGVHVLNEKPVKKILNNMKKILENHEVKYEQVFLGTLGAVIGIHVGPNSIGVGWSIKDD